MSFSDARIMNILRAVLLASVFVVEIVTAAVLRCIWFVLWAPIYLFAAALHMDCDPNILSSLLNPFTLSVECSLISSTPEVC